VPARVFLNVAAGRSVGSASVGETGVGLGGGSGAASTTAGGVVASASFAAASATTTVEGAVGARADSDAGSAPAVGEAAASADGGCDVSPPTTEGGCASGSPSDGATTGGEGDVPAGRRSTPTAHARNNSTLSRSRRPSADGSALISAARSASSSSCPLP